jgi:hypothetical protein
LSLSYWIDNLGFITEGKLAAIFIKTFSWGFPTRRSFLLHQLGPIKFSGAVAGERRRIISLANWAPSSFLAPLPGRKKTSARGVFARTSFTLF